MPLKNGYDFDNFQSGWSKIEKHRRAVDPRELNVWAGNVWAVLPLKFGEQEPPQKTRNGLARLDRFAQTISAGIFRQNIHNADPVLAYVLGGPFDAVEGALRRAIARLYEASDCVAMQQVRDRELLYEGGVVAQKLLKGQKQGPKAARSYHELLARAAAILGELRIESPATSAARSRNIHFCNRTKTESIENLLELRKSDVPRGRREDRAKVFLIWRLAELYFLMTRKHPTFTFSRNESANSPDFIRNPFQHLLTAVFDLTGLHYTIDGLDHYLRIVGQIEHYQSSMLEESVFGPEDSPRGFQWRSRDLTLPSTGILLDYQCREFYGRDIYPPTLEIRTDCQEANCS